MSEFFCAPNHNWTDNGTLPTQWLLSAATTTFSANTTMKQAGVHNYPQYTASEQKEMTQTPKWRWTETMIQNLLESDRILPFWTREEMSKVQLVETQQRLNLASYLALAQGLSPKDHVVLLLWACLAHIAPSGEEAVAKLYEHYQLTDHKTPAQFATALSLQTMVLLNSQSAYPIPELRTNEGHLLIDLLVQQTTPISQATELFGHAYNDRAAKRRLSLLALLQDTETLNEWHEAGKLNVAQLQTRSARRSILLAARLNGLL